MSAPKWSPPWWSIFGWTIMVLVAVNIINQVGKFEGWW